MRISCSHTLALLTLWCALAVAIPSPSSVDQNALGPASTESRSWWRRVSGRVIESIWGHEGAAEEALKRTHPIPQQAPPHATSRYDRDVVIRFNVSTAEEVQSLAEAADTLVLDVWEFSRDWVDIRLGKDILPNLLGFLQPSLQHKHAPLLGDRDLAQAIADTYPDSRGRTLTQPTATVSHLRSRPITWQADGPVNAGDESSNDFFNDYQSLRVIEPWMRLLAELFNTHVQLITVGTSYEGREIHALRVGVHPTNNEDPDPPKRKTILVTGGVHAIVQSTPLPQKGKRQHAALSAVSVAH